MCAKVGMTDPPPPGPGSYNPGMSHKPTHPSFSMRGKHSHVTKGKDFKEPPGPGHYKAENFKRIVTSKDLGEKVKNLPGAAFAGKVDQGSVDNPPGPAEYQAKVGDAKVPKFDSDIAPLVKTAPAFSLGQRRPQSETHCEVFAKQKAKEDEIGPGKYLLDNCAEGAFKANYKHEKHLPMFSMRGKDYVNCMKDFGPSPDQYKKENYNRIITQKDLPEGKKTIPGATFSGRIWEGMPEHKPAYYK